MKHKFTPLTKLVDKDPVLEQGSPSLLHVSQFKLKLKPDIPVSFFFLSRVFDLIVQFENNFKVMNSTRGILERLDAGEVILSRLKSKYKYCWVGKTSRWSLGMAATSTPWRREVMSRCNSWKEILLSELSVRRATTPQRAVSNTLKLLNNWLKSEEQY